MSEFHPRTPESGIRPSDVERPNIRHLAHFGRLACQLLLGMSMLLMSQSCVLPPPAPIKDAAEPLLFIDYDKVEPATVVNSVSREPADKVVFTLQNALVLPEGAETPNVFWYLAYDNDVASFEDGVGLEFTVDGCEKKIGGNFVETFSVEALITYGSVFQSSSAQGDKRQTNDGEPIFRVVWSIVAEGDSMTECN